jgi:hypothetical protein
MAGWTGVIWGIAFVPSNPIVRIEPATFAGRCLPILSKIDVGDQLARGSWTLVFFRHDCETYRKEIPKYERLAKESGETQRFALIEVPSAASAAKIPLAQDSACLLGRLTTSPNWIIRTPAEIKLRDCIVQP